jgi:uncharacterized membrane protein
VPAPNGLAGLRLVLPSIFLYLLTFVQIGIYWVNHHYLVDEVETVSHGILWTNLMFLFCLSLFPFATEWIGIKGLSSFTTSLYAAVSIFPGLGYMALWSQIRSKSTASAHASWGKQIASVILYLTAIPMAYFRPAASLAADNDRLSAMVIAAKVREPPRVRIAASSCDGQESHSSNQPRGRSYLFVSESSFCFSVFGVEISFASPLAGDLRSLSHLDAGAGCSH